METAASQAFFVRDLKKHRSVEILREDALVAELESLGIRYLFRAPTVSIATHVPPEDLLVALIHQPSSRVRHALIALFLLHPELASFVPAALRRLRGNFRRKFKFSYTAAVFLQQIYLPELKAIFPEYSLLPDLFSAELLPANADTARKNLSCLGEQYRACSGEVANWSGTYEHAAQQLLRQLKVEARWNR